MPSCQEGPDTEITMFTFEQNCEEKVLINSFVDIILENFEGEGEILTKVIFILHHSLIEKVACKPLQ